ncbi:hypothetical protein ATO6_07045 [Oceanicola sp. 22II-s10i]|uniref:alpha/beta hydrolase n=1 Tax=Oceanicola sp. 22II-s10i TaxID=1317116 RepID=UPI000B527ED5|nr:alpha/beta hydrolase [Oceanicola sp. 22II-s10i]OWU86537.1 hypothetical protein ATO6_07045 [Oceanicola sp. 22II-s10i]
MTDYDSLIDPEVRAFIRRTEASCPPDATGLTIEDNRRLYDAMCTVFRHPRPAGLTIIDAPVGGVPCRRYDPPSPGPAVVIYAHGGGHVLGGLDSHDDICAEIADRTGLGVIAVDYRLAPEHPHPAQIDDMLAVVQATAPEAPLILAGDSAGGNLASAAAHLLRGSDVRLKGMVLIYPGLGGPPGESHVTHAHAPMLSAQEVEDYGTIRFAGGIRPPDDPSFAPLADTDFSGLPPVFASAAECDPLASDVPRYCDKVRAAGGQAEAVTEPGLVHGHLRARHMSTRAAAAFDRIVAAIAAMAQAT